MPTVVLLDTSLSMSRKVGGESHIEIAQRGITQFSQLLEKKQPLEKLSLLTFDTDIKILHEFTKDHNSFRSSIQKVSLGSKANVMNAIARTSEYIEEIWGYVSNSLCQIILITDSSSDIKEVEIEFKRAVRLHVILIGREEEVDEEYYNSLAQKYYGTFKFCPFPHSISSIKQTFLDLILVNYPNYQGILAMGFLRSMITLQPDPNIELYHTIATNKEVSKIAFHIDIIGFIGKEHIPNPPILSKHLVIVNPLSHSTEFESLILDSHYFYVILQKSLEKQNSCALVRLRDNWFALLSPISKKDYSYLTLSILPPDLTLPWMGRVADLSTISTNESSISNFPTKNVYPMSYYYSTRGPPPIPSISAESLQADFAKILKLVHGLPQKQDQLISELERLKNISNVYYFHDIIPKVTELLEIEYSEFQKMPEKNGTVTSIMHNLITQLRQPGVLDRPLERHGVKTRSAQDRVNISSLLN